jgi:hypothetical protein
MDSNRPIGQSNSETSTNFPIRTDPLLQKYNKPSRKYHFEDFVNDKIIGHTFGEKLAWIICLIALVFNIISIIFYFNAKAWDNSPETNSATSFWVISVVLACLSAYFFFISIKSKKEFLRTIFRKPKHHFSNFVKAIQKRTEKLSFGVLPHLLVVAFFLRFIPLQKDGLFLDEWYWLDSAKRILAGTIQSPFGFIGDQPSNLTAFPVALFLAIFKNPYLGVRLPGVIYSLITIIFVFLLLKKSLSKKAAYVGSFLLAISVWDIHNTGLGWNNVIVNPMLISGVLYFLFIIFSREYDARSFFWLAFLLSICVHLLYVAALMVIPTVCTFLYLIINGIREKIGPKLKEYIIFALFFFICVSPIIPKLIKYSVESIGRHGDFIDKNIALAEEAQSPTDYYVEQVKLLWNDLTIGKGNFQTIGLWGITIEPIILILFLIAIPLVFVQVKRKKSNSFWLIIIVSLFTLLVIPFVVLYRTTSTWRAYACIPIIYLLATFSLYHFSKLEAFLTKKYSITKKKKLMQFFLITNCLLYLLLSVNWYKSFFDNYLVKLQTYETEICRSASHLIDENVPEGSTVFLPDEMCSPLIRILYDEDQYRFVSILPNGPEMSIERGHYLIILNAQYFKGVFNENIQKMAEKIIGENDAQLLSRPSTTQPILYLIH